jgi:AcrR family transcriptional regulator
MRITAEKAVQTRRRLLKVAGELFGERGFEETTTRDVAARAGLASGTLFNYYRSKEELALGLVIEHLTEANTEFETLRRPAGSLEEWLFAFVTTELRHLAPIRPFLLDILNGVLHPFAAEDTSAGTVRRVPSRPIGGMASCRATRRFSARWPRR